MWEKIFHNFSCFSTTSLHEKPLPNFMQIKLYFGTIVRHIRSAILNFSSLTSNSESTTQKTQDTKFHASQIDFSNLDPPY